MEGAGCCSSGLGMSPGTWCRKLLREAGAGAGAGCRVLCPWPGLGGGAGGGGVRVALLVVGGAGVGVVLAGGLGVPVGRVGVACVRRVALAVPDWLWRRGVGGRRPHERPGGAVVRM